MDSVFDLTVYPIAIRDGQEQLTLPGLGVFTAPRRSARGRTGDQLVVLLSLAGNAPLTSESLQRVLDRAAEAYYQTAGSVTAGLRAATDTVNQYLLERNLRNTSADRQSAGLLQLAAVHGQSLVLAQAGPVHAYLLRGAQVDHFADPAATRGLGLSQSSVPRFSQALLESNDRVVLSAEAMPPAVQSILQGEILPPTLGASGSLPPSLTAAVFTVRNGSGRTALYQAGSAVLASEPPRSSASRQLREEPAEPAAPPAAPVAPATAPAAAPVIPAPAARPTPPAAEAAPAPRPTARPQPQPARPAPQPPASAAAAAEPAAEPEPAGAGIKQSLARLIQRLLPGRSDQPRSLSSGLMVFIAIAVPVIIVTAALVVYTGRGRQQRFDLLFAQAVQAAVVTQEQTDPSVLRTAWDQSLYYLDQALAIQPDHRDALALREQAQTAIDELDAIRRFDFQPAIIGQLPSDTRVTGIVATGADLYLLNRAGGNVLRAQMTPNGYQVDPSFNCGPGQVGGVSVDALVDIASLPRGNEFGATILGLDSHGNALFCTPGSAPSAFSLVAPDNNFKEIAAITIDPTALYVLDRGNNAVWVYLGSEYREAPHLFFGNDIPDLTNAVDLAVNAVDLLVLHGDGHLTWCTQRYAGDDDPRCADPRPYTDPRPGQPPAPATIPSTVFSQIQYSSPPDPSYYFLDSNSGAIYHFSLKLNLQRQIRDLGGANPVFPTRPATAFAVSANRVAFVAFDHQVFYAQLP